MSKINDALTLAGYLLTNFLVEVVAMAAINTFGYSGRISLNWMITLVAIPTGLSIIVALLKWLEWRSDDQPEGEYRADPNHFQFRGSYSATSCACATASAIRPRVGQSRKGQKGQGLIEYALILTFIAVVIVTAILWFEKSAILPGLFQSLFNGLGQ